MKYWRNHIAASWHHSLSMLWLLIIARQWISYTEPVWLNQTTNSVWIVLILVSIIEILFPMKSQFRLILEFIVIFYVVYRTLIYYGVYVPDPWAMTLSERLQDVGTHMLPYIWFALGGAALLLLCARLVSSKRRILWFIGMNIVAFAALDSFTSIVLWQEVAWIVFAGMGWLVSSHLRSFQQNYPRGWVYLLDYPFKLVINIAVVFSLVILIGVNMPDIRPTLKDPYTAWLEWNGSGKPTGIGKSRSGQSGAGTVSSNNNTSSGYSLDDSELGGGFNFDFTPVMTVNSDLRTYMRGETRRVYSGSGWIDKDPLERGPIVEVEVGQLLESIDAPKVTTRTLKQTVNILHGSEFPVMFGAYSFATVDTLNSEKDGPGLNWGSRGSEMLWDTDNNGYVYPVTYELTSEVPIIPVQELSARTYDELYVGNEIEELFLQLPNDFPERVKLLAEEITINAQTPYEKTVLLQQYLQQTFPYTNEPDLTRITSPDFVDGFLFEMKEGYCDYYSTALIAMARSLDIPARWVKGYAPGEPAELPDNLSLQQMSAISNKYTITNADAHSWAEVYFGEYGWIPIEATPGFNFPLLTQNEQSSETDLEEMEDEEEPLDPLRNTGDNIAGERGFKVGDWVVLLAAAVLLIWLSFVVWHQRFKLRFLIERLKMGRTLSPDQKVVAETDRWVRYLNRKGMMKNEHETLREAVGRWSLERPDVADILSSLLVMFEQAKYSPDVIEDKDWRSVYTEALRLRRNMKARK